MSTTDTYPATYRSREVAEIRAAVAAGECASVVGLSGAGKSNLLGFLAQEWPLLDCNRLLERTPLAFFRLARRALGDRAGALGDRAGALGDRAGTLGDRAGALDTAEQANAGDASEELARLEQAIERRLQERGNLCLLLDRLDAFPPQESGLLSSLRALRDAHKYRLTYVIAARRPLDPRSELAELFYAHTLWLGPLSEADARWNLARYAQRYRALPGLDWDAAAEALLSASGRYPSFLKAVGEAYAAGSPLDLDSLRAHPAVQRRLTEFWADAPSEDELRFAGLLGNPLLARPDPAQPGEEMGLDTNRLTAKELLLLQYFQAHAGEVCIKDELIRAVWPEDRVFLEGVRDDALAQLVRRLRKKVERDPAAPEHIQSVPGRGYVYKL